MTQPPQSGRIVVALDDSVHARAALDAAAELAARVGAELVGVYVEDADLFRIADLPFAAELSGIGGAPRALSAAGLQRSLKLEADRLRGLVAQAAAHYGARWQFRSVRGPVADSLIAAAEEADLLVLGKASTTSVRSMRVGRTARTVVARSTRTVVVLQHGARIAKPVVVLYDASPGAERALAAAARWAQLDGDGLVVLIPAMPPSVRAAAEARAAAALVQAGAAVAHVRFVALETPGLTGLLDALRAEGCKTLVVDASSPLIDGVNLADLAAALECPLAVAR